MQDSKDKAIIVRPRAGRNDALPQAAKNPYVTPELREEGSVEQLTGHGLVAGSGGGKP